jgi:SpoIIAA-like
MIEKIPGLPDNVLGFTAKGNVTADDYESVIIPAVEALFARQPKVRFLYHLGKDLAGFEAAAMWDDAKLGFKHFSGWERMAVVSDIDWIRAAVKLFGLMMPGHVRAFQEGELADAKRWISE